MSATTLIVGCGYLGTRVGRRLIERGERVIGTVRSAARAETLRNLGIEPVILDVLDPGSLNHLPAADRVFYSIGYDRASGASFRSVSIDGLRNVLERLAHRPGPLVYASSTGVYGQGGEVWVDEDSETRPTPESGQVVLEAETHLRDNADRLGLSFLVLRFSGLYGPGRIPRRASLERGEPIAGDPDRPINLIHVEDAALATVAALDRGTPGRTYLISDDRPIKRREFYTLAASMLGAPGPTFIVPEPGSPEAQREEASKRIRNQRMRLELGISLLFPDIYTGLPAALGPEASKPPR